MCYKIFKISPCLYIHVFTQTTLWGGYSRGGFFFWGGGVGLALLLEWIVVFPNCLDLTTANGIIFVESLFSEGLYVCVVFVYGGGGEGRWGYSEGVNVPCFMQNKSFIFQFVERLPLPIITLIPCHYENRQYYFCNHIYRLNSWSS